MTEVISVKFKSMGKTYFFAPNGNTVATGDPVVIETAKGLEMAECVYGNHMVEDTSVVQPLRPVIRIATESDLRVAEINKEKEKEAYDICKQKISEHGLEMKLVDVECNFEGNKTTFFFTADGRVDFRDLVKDLAGVFRNRIELRQIGVRDEAKMIGGLGICGRPYCCNQFLEDFQPVSTKMAKVQSLSLNPTKISGSCGRLMCCLRYEQAAYEDLVKKVPKQGAFVETKDGYGTAVQVNLLRQTVKVRLDGDNDDTLKLFKSNELAAVPGGRPKEGEPYPSVLHYVPEEEESVEEEPADVWAAPVLVVPEPVNPEPETADEESGEGKKPRRRHRGGRGRNKTEGEAKSAENTQSQRKGGDKPREEKRTAPGKTGEKSGKKPNAQNKAVVKPVKVEPKAEENAKSGEQPHRSNRRRHYRKPRPKQGGES